MAKGTPRPAHFICAHCGQQKDTPQRGPVPTYCSGTCRTAVKHLRHKADGRYQQQRDTRQAKRHAEREARHQANARPCPYCGDPMTHPRRVQCGKPECKRQWQADRVREWQQAYKAEHGEWATAKYATTEKSRATTRARKERTGHWRKNYPESAAKADALRRMRKDTPETESFAPAHIYERDRWKCGVCRRKVNPSLAWPHPMSPSLDHVVPLSEGGSHTMANTRLAHLRCNVSRNNRGGDEQLALLG